MKEGKGFSESFIVGVIAVVFLVIGYQTALFIHRAAVMKVAAGRDEPDTVFVYRGFIDDSVPDDMEGDYAENSTHVQRKNGYHAPHAESVREKLPRKKVESFRFDPNTVSIEELCRLGFTPKQAQAIDNYREKGGRFRRKTDFAKSFVVSDSVYRRLEQYIDIPLTDLNLADSAAFDALPGIGGWFGGKMISEEVLKSSLSVLDLPRSDKKEIVTIMDDYTLFGGILIWDENEIPKLQALVQSILGLNDKIKNEINTPDELRSFVKNKLKTCNRQNIEDICFVLTYTGQGGKS